eukprot:2609318-Alexandrium_andersonii.AAC.1
MDRRQADPDPPGWPRSGSRERRRAGDLGRHDGRRCHTVRARPGQPGPAHARSWQQPTGRR